MMIPQYSVNLYRVSNTSFLPNGMVSPQKRLSTSVSSLLCPLRGHSTFPYQSHAVPSLKNQVVHSVHKCNSSSADSLVPLLLKNGSPSFKYITDLIGSALTVPSFQRHKVFNNSDYRLQARKSKTKPESIGTNACLLDGKHRYW
uniref:ParB domain-containing protein n=1 Tax=Steinernema glaseri TaxID=37863 RepID=A0A1I8AF43_9BILA